MALHTLPSIDIMHTGMTSEASVAHLNGSDPTTSKVISTSSKGASNKEETADTKPSSFITELNQHDVLMGRGLGASQYSGNRSFLRVVESFKADYNKTKSYKEKALVAKKVHSLITAAKGGRFIKLTNPTKGARNVVKEGVWRLAKPSEALEKCKQALRQQRDVSVQVTALKQEADAPPSNNHREEATTPDASFLASPHSQTWLVGTMNGSTTSNDSLELMRQTLFPGEEAFLTDPDSHLHVDTLEDTLTLPALEGEDKDEVPLTLEVGNPNKDANQDAVSRRYPHNYTLMGMMKGTSNDTVQQTLLSEEQVGGQALSILEEVSKFCLPDQDAHGKRKQVDDPVPGGQDANKEKLGFSSSPQSQSTMGMLRGTGNDLLDLLQETLLLEGEEAGGQSISETSAIADPLLEEDHDDSTGVLSPLLNIDSLPEDLAVSSVAGCHTFTEEQEEEERTQLSDSERAAVMADLFGKQCSVDDLGRNKRAKRLIDNSTMDFCLQDMKKELTKIPENEKKAVLKAQAECKNKAYEFSDNRMARFLQCEGMNPKLAARRFVEYWEGRREVFGYEKFLLPMTLNEALQDDLAAIENGVAFILPHLDSAGRMILYVEPHRRSFKRYSSESMLRAFWYIMEVLSNGEDDVVSKGYVSVTWVKNATIWDYDHHVYSRVPRYQDMCFPIRQAGAHTCCPGWASRKIIGPVIAAIATKESRLRRMCHCVAESEIVGVLLEYGITRQMLPKEMGGRVDLSFSN